MTQDERSLVLMIMLCMRCALGGAEKRYTRVFKMLALQPGAQHKLLINRSMLNLLQAGGILSQIDESCLIVLDPPSHRCAQSSGVHGLTRRTFRLFQPILELLDAFWYAWQCWRVIRRYKPKVVHPLLSGMYLSLPALLLQPKIGHVISAYATQFKPDNYAHNSVSVHIGFAIKRYAMRRCHAIDALKLSIRDDLVAHGIDGDRIHTAPCSFADFSLCRPASQKEKWVVFLGRLVDHKNPLLLARAIPIVVAQVPDVHFYFLGEGHLQSRLETLVRELNVADHVTIKFEFHPTRILNRSSIFASMQTRGNYPSQSLLEAMACGNAIVATDVGETWRLVDDLNGVRVPLTVDAVAEAIIRLLNDPNLAQLGLASRQRALSEHTPERFFDYITNLYRTVVTGLHT